MSITTPEGRAVRVKRLKAGDHFGYDALLADTHDTTVSCLTDVELTAVPQEDLRLATKRDGAGGYLQQTIEGQVACMPFGGLLMARDCLPAADDRGAGRLR